MAISQRFTSPAARSFAPVARTVPSVLGRSTPSRLQQRLNGAAFIHRPVALGHLLQRQRQIEDLAGVDLPVQHQLDQLGQVAPHGRGAAVKVNVGEEQLRAVEFHLVRDADVGDVPALTRAVDGGLPIQLAKSMDDDPDTIKAKSDYLESLNQKLEDTKPVLHKLMGSLNKYPNSSEIDRIRNRLDATFQRLQLLYG